MRSMLSSRFSLKTLIPVLVLIAVAVGLVTLVGLIGRDPVVTAIDPVVARVGDLLAVQGRHFGSERGEVWIAGTEVPMSTISTWGPERIEFTVPRGADSGLLFVVTDGGRSEGVLLQMEHSVPRSDEVSFIPGTPQIARLKATEAEIGSILVIEGENFGAYRRASRVLFSSPTDSGAVAPEPASVSYPVWTDDTIHVRVPSGVQSGFVSVDTAWGRSNPMRLRILRPSGQLVRTDRTEIAVRYEVGISSVGIDDDRAGSPGASDLIVWLPTLESGIGQGNIRYLEAPAEEQLSPDAAVAGFRYEQVADDFTVVTRRTVVADRYGLRLEIDPSRVSPVYEGESGFFAYFTAPMPDLPSEAEEFADVAAKVRRNRANPYQIGRAAYDWVLDHMEVALDPADRGAAAGMSQAFGDDYTYSAVLVTILRAARVPSRMVGGVLLGGDEVYPHFWAELFVPAVGWVPADPFLGDGGFPAGFAELESARDFYFGSLDSARLAFHHGYSENGPGQRDGVQIADPDPLSAQRSYVEVGPAIVDIDVDWARPRLISSRSWVTSTP